jgi:hypothetical protein
VTTRILITSALLLAACSKPQVGATLADTEAALTKSGLKLSTFSPADAARFSAQRCTTGTIEGIDAALCEYGSVEAVQQGKHSAEAWIGDAVTGAALENGRHLLAVADRTRADTNGKTIHRITKAFRELK